MLPNCLEVLNPDKNKYTKIDSEDNLNTRSSQIIPLSEAGIPLDSNTSSENLNLDSSDNQVEISLVLNIPSQSQ